ncbi:hypothetical protein ACFQZI_19935 [Mucilaginibacter lutimaris]|uniref:YD repeat-containing protein n=1 Tax=Mucilaginibacter lutimaris TaxID=931629 RepID=A0ABW2ZMC0_9SPHI
MAKEISKSWKSSFIWLWISVNVLVSFTSKGQNSVKQPSPSANFSNTFNPDVDLFTGKLDVNFNLIDLKFAGEDLSVKLKYLSGNGVKVSELPSWVGLGWGLNTPGYIYRVIKGKPDELQTYKSELNILYDSFGDPSILGSIKTILTKSLATTPHVQNRDYLINYPLLNTNDWNSVSKIMSYKSSDPISSFYSTGWQNQGSASNPAPTFRKTDIITTNMNPVIDLVPDDFIVQIGELSGVFFKDFTGMWSFVSNNNLTCKVEVFVDDYYMTGSLRTPGVINKIVLTSSKGIKYTFEGDFENSKVSTAAQYGYFIPPSGNYFYDLTPTLWNIAKVENLNTQEQIVFNYSPSYYQGSKFYSAFGTSNNIIYNNTTIATSWNSTDWNSYNANYKVMHQTKKLESIICSNGYKIIFDSSLSSQLLSDENIHSEQEFNQDPVLYGAALKYNLYKLNSISIYNESTLIKQVKFKFNEKATERLQLGKIEFTDGTNVYDFFSFSYNQEKLPVYDSRQTDHWGYYNGVDFFSKYTKGPYSDAILTSFSNYKLQDAVLSKAEILESVSSASGAKSVFAYEPNDYHAQVDDDTRQVIPLPSDQPNHGAGLRIKNITASDREKELLSKSYYYTLENGTTSGILAVPPPRYLSPNPPLSDAGTYSFDLRGFSTNVSNSGNVTYSRVIEKVGNLIATINEFTNFDNSFGDQVSATKNFTTTVFDIKNAFLDFSFKRGKLKSVKKMSNDQTLPVEEKVFKYQHDFSDSEFPEYRAIYMSNSTPDFFYSAISYKRYPDLLREVKTVANEKSGTVVSIKKLKYDSYNNLIEETSETSKGTLNKITYKYPYNFSSDVYQEMISKSLLTSVIEQTSTIDDNRQILLSRINFDRFNSNNILLPKSMEVQVGNGPLRTKALFNRYDLKGNLLEKQVTDGAPKVVYLWSYKGQYPVAEVTGSDYATVTSVLTQAQIDAAADSGEEALRNLLNTLRTDSRTKNAQTITYTYLPLVGTASSTDAKGMTTYYDYDDFKRLMHVKDKDKNIISRYDYHYLGL